MFDITRFIMATLQGMVGKYPDFQVREYALNWYAKGKLTEENLATVDDWIAELYITEEPEEIVEGNETVDAPVDPEVTEEPTEETTEPEQEEVITE